jgi:hypothetical protein
VAKEFLGLGRLRVIINAGGKDVEDFAIELLLRGANPADPFDQFFKVVAFAAFQPGVVEDKAFHQVFAQRPGGPDAELGAAMGFDPVADGDNHIQVVKGDDHALAFLLNCCKKCIQFLASIHLL